MSQQYNSSIIESHKLEDGFTKKDETVKPIEISKSKMTKDQKMMLLLLCYGNFLSGVAYSILTPFFPTIAKSRDVSEFWIGAIIANRHIFFFFGSILFTKLIPRLTIKYTLLLGLFVSGFSNFLFGLLQWWPQNSSLVMMALIIRTIEGIGVAAFFTGAFTLILLEFPNDIGKTFATLEMFMGVGMIFGPGIGGLLNQFGEKYFNAGFCLPFFLIAIFLIIGSILAHFSFNITNKMKFHEKIGIVDVLSNFGVLLTIVLEFNGFFLLGFNESTLDLHLGTIQVLSSSAKGGIFLISGAIYALLNNLWGYLAEKLVDCCLIGCICCMICFSISGPMPFLGLEPQLWLVIVAQIFLGLGMGGLFVGSFVQAHRETLRSGFPETMSTYAVISGIFNSTLAIGSGMGSQFGGYSMGEWGYQWTTFSLVTIQLALIITIILFHVFRRFERVKTREKV